MMKRRTINIIIVFIVLLVLIGTGIGIYFVMQQGPAVGSVEGGKRYYLSEIHPTDLFKGAQFNSESYFQIKKDRKTGEIYLKIDDSTTPIPFIITKYKETNKDTIIEFEYVRYAGDDGEETHIQRLTAISTKDEIRIKNVESHDIRVIQQDPTQIDKLEYTVTVLVFKSNQEGA